MAQEQSDLLAQCQANGLRNTPALRTLLEVLLAAELPQSLQDLEGDEKLAAQCDRATIFRNLQRLENVGLLRRLNFAHKGAKFTLYQGSAHKEYLVCSQCGNVRELDLHCPVGPLEQSLAEQTGFSELTHELTFYGVCPACTSTGSGS